MAKNLDPRLVEILQQYHPDPRSALWDCRGTWVILHKAVEIIAAKAGVRFDPPMIIEASAEKKIVSICVTGYLGDHSEWSIGEAAPSNNKNSYPYAMAEKRAKDRVVLKLVGLHGYIYAEDEADDFIATKPAEEPDQEWIEAAIDSKIADHIDQTQAIVDHLIAEIKTITVPKEMLIWAAKNSESIAELPEDWQDSVRAAYSKHNKMLKEAA